MVETPSEEITVGAVAPLVTSWRRGGRVAGLSDVEVQYDGGTVVRDG